MYWQKKLVLFPGFSQDILTTAQGRLCAQKEVADTKLMVFLELSCLICLVWELFYLISLLFLYLVLVSMAIFCDPVCLLLGFVGF